MGRWGSTLSSLHRPVSDHLASPSRKFLNVLLESLTSRCQHVTALIAEDSFSLTSNPSQGKGNDLILKSPTAMEFNGFFTSQRSETITFGIFGTLGHGAICSGSAREWSFSRHGVKLGRRFSSTSIQEVEVKCWSCEETSSEIPFFVCPSCRAIQPLDQELDYFQLLSLDRSFELDLKVLERKYKNLQKFLHPDLSSLKSEREQGYSADQSAQVIKAYYTLIEPLSRAQYLLKLNGIHTDEEGTIHDPALLMEIMELREEVEDANDPKKLEEIKENWFECMQYWGAKFIRTQTGLNILNKNKKKMVECEKALKAVFQGGDVTRAIPVVQRMTYYNKINEEITRKQ